MTIAKKALGCIGKLCLGSVGLVAWVGRRVL